MDNSSSKFGENYLYFPRLQYEQAQGLHNYFKIKSLPSMLVFNMKGKLVSLTGVEDIQKFREHTLRLWGSINWDSGVKLRDRKWCLIFVLMIVFELKYDLDLLKWNKLCNSFEMRGFKDYDK